MRRIAWEDDDTLPAAARMSARIIRYLVEERGDPQLHISPRCSEAPQCHIPISIEDTTQLGQSQGEKNSRSLRMDIVTESGCLLKNDDNLKTRSILIDLATPNPCGNTLLDRSARRGGYAIGEVAGANNNEC